MQVAREHGIFVPYFCWHPQLSVAGNCRMCLVEVEGRGLDIACNMPVNAGMKVFTESEGRQGAPQGDPAVHHAQPPGGLRHLRQGRRVHAAGLPLHLQRRGLAVARREGALDQVLQPVEPHPARQRAVHPLPALHALHARGVEVDGPRRRAPWRRLEHPSRRGPPARRGPVLRQHHRHLPGRRAAVAAVPAQVAGVVPRAHAVGVPRLRARLHDPGLAPQARVVRQVARPAAEHQHRARHAAREPCRERPVDLQQGPRPRALLRADPRRRADAQGPARAGGRGARRRAPPDRAQRAIRWRSCRTGARTRSSRRSSAISARCFHCVREARLGARGRRAARGRPADPPRQEPEHRPGARALRRGRARLPRRHRPRAGLGRGLRLRAHPAEARRSSFSIRTCSRRTATRTCSFRSASRPSAPGTTPISRAW
jgi:hypothetical protein